jgi:SAM-dependent methyltransferase
VPRIDNDRFYDEAIGRYGFSAKGLHWQSASNQQKRFDALLKPLPTELTDISIADAGCGLADLYGHLAKSGKLPKAYIGLELKQEFILEARKRYGCEVSSCDILNDPLPGADYYLCSGAMNILTRDETKQFIRRCYEVSDKGFVFNMLEGPSTSSLLYNYYWPEEMKAFCTTLCDDVKIYRGYLKHDFTVSMMKAGRS